LTASFILKNDGFTKRQFKELLHDPENIRQKRLKKEIEEVIESDFIYSPQGIENQKNRGIFCEEQIQKWLDERGIEYCTEEESRALERQKTPDFLLKCPMEYNGKTINWVESKGSFGSPYQTRYDYDNQLSHYVKLFGPGMVSYWLGYVDDIHMGKDIVMVDRRFFED
ncbi:MAG TPA: C15orf41 family protein, partial [Candidatus Methanofastidiosa archaeon]|nr:C15orf41 family protein [Candidatus Methanofastidiosa archaeon]